MVASHWVAVVEKGCDWLTQRNQHPESHCSAAACHFLCGRSQRTSLQPHTHLLHTRRAPSPPPLPPAVMRRSGPRLGLSPRPRSAGRPGGVHGRRWRGGRGGTPSGGAPAFVPPLPQTSCETSPDLLLHLRPPPPLWLPDPGGQTWSSAGHTAARDHRTLCPDWRDRGHVTEGGLGACPEPCQAELHSRGLRFPGAQSGGALQRETPNWTRRRGGA